MNRRDMLYAAGTLGVLMSSRTVLGEALECPFDAGDEGEFAHKPVIAHFNAAHLCPMPVRVRAALQRADRMIDMEPSQANEDHFEEQRERLRTRLKGQLNAASADEFAFVRNATEANNAIVNGFPFEPGDEIVVWQENHPSNNVAWDVRAARDRLVVRRVSFDRANASVPTILEAFGKAMNSRTRVLALTHVSNVSGFRLPVDELCAHARERDVFVHVDGAQTWGAVPLDLSSMKCNSFCGSAHKWMMGPREVGLLYVRSEDVERLSPSVVGLGWGAGPETTRRGARKFDCFGQRNDAATAALHEALDLQEESEIGRIVEHNLAIVAAISERCRQLGVPILASYDADFASSIVVLSAPVGLRASLVKELYDRYQVTASTRGGVRLSPHIYNDADDVERVFDAIAALAPRLRGAM